jgi:hypothetical protein
LISSKLSRARPKVLSGSQHLENGSGGIDARKRDAIIHPVKLNILLLKDKNGNQGADSDGAGEG